MIIVKMEKDYLDNDYYQDIMSSFYTFVQGDVFICLEDEWLEIKKELFHHEIALTKFEVESVTQLNYLEKG